MARLTRFYQAAKQADGTYSLQEYLSLMDNRNIESKPTKIALSGIHGKALAERIAEALAESYLDGRADAQGNPRDSYRMAEEGGK